MKKAHTHLPNLDAERAESLLALHCGASREWDSMQMESGLLSSLRAWNGRLNPTPFHEVMACIKALGPGWSEPTISNGPILDLWSLLYLGTGYVSDPARTKRRKEILEPDQWDVESRWLDCIGNAVMVFLERDDPDEAFNFYDNFMAGN